MGLVCEAAVRGLLEARGWRTWDTAEAVGTGYGILHAGGRRLRLERPAGRGPQLVTDGCWLTAPDILAERGDEVRWVEVKRKELGAHAWCSYQQVQAATGWPVWLVMWHAASLKPGGPQGWTANSLDELGKIGGPESQERRRGMPRLRYFWAERLRYLTPQ
jgi:hypothetical protein